MEDDKLSHNELYINALRELDDAASLVVKRAAKADVENRARLAEISAEIGKMLDRRI